MVLGPGLDRLELILPDKVRFTDKFGPHWNSEANEKLFKIGSDPMYFKTGDLRGIGIDARLACGNRFHPKSGPKLVIFEMGKKTFSDVVAIGEELFAGDICEASMPRVDLTADTEGIPVSEFERSLYVLHKQTSQTEYGENERVSRAYRRGAGETVYFGRGKGQVRIYNKTAERMQRLVQINKQRKRHGQPGKSFEEEYGYDPQEIRTRVEKQCGERFAETEWGIRYLGEIHRLAGVKPFENFRFAYDANRVRELEDLDDSMRGYILLLRKMAMDTSMADVDCFLRQNHRNPESCRKFKRRYRHLFTPQTFITGEFLTEQFSRSIIAQLAA